MKKTTILKTGLLFGSFNPIHTGHLIIAQHFIQQQGLDEVWFVVSPQNPFKTTEFMPDASARIELVRMAIEGNPSFSVCDAELSMPRPSYTVHTLKLLREKHQNHEFFLLMGSDNLKDFHLWKNHEQITELVKIWVYPRGDADDKWLEHPAFRLTNDAPRVEISSTAIRKAIASGKSPRYLLPEMVYEQIMKQGYYVQS